MVEKIKKAIAPFYTDRCTVYEKRAVEKEGRTCFEESLIYENVPCRISAKSYLFGEKAAKDNGRFLQVEKRVKVFLPPEYEIKPGSRMEILRYGKKNVFAKSSIMSFFGTHNEVSVEFDRDYA